MSPTRASQERQRGLTLVETLVAFAILTGVVASLVALLSQTARYMASAEDRFLASLLANNLMVEELARIEPSPRGSSTDQAFFAGRDFDYVRTGVEVRDGVVQVTFDVKRAGEDALLARTAALRGATR
ncbi:MAG: type II secretion system minor pseudopilin GspI [Pseudomonadota bacterium]